MHLKKNGQEVYVARSHRQRDNNVAWETIESGDTLQCEVWSAHPRILATCQLKCIYADARDYKIYERCTMLFVEQNNYHFSYEMDYSKHLVSAYEEGQLCDYALQLIHAHGLPLNWNTVRSISLAVQPNVDIDEIKQYMLDTYGLWNTGE